MSEMSDVTCDVNVRVLYGNYHYFKRGGEIQSIMSRDRHWHVNMNQSLL